MGATLKRRHTPDFLGLGPILYGWGRTGGLAVGPIAVVAGCHGVWLVGRGTCGDTSNGSTAALFPVKRGSNCHGSRFSHVGVPSAHISLRDRQSNCSQAIPPLCCTFRTACRCATIAGTRSALLLAITAMYRVKQRVHVVMSATLRPCCCCCWNCWRAPRTPSCTSCDVDCCSSACTALLVGRKSSISINSKSHIRWANFDVIVGRPCAARKNCGFLTGADCSAGRFPLRHSCPPLPTAYSGGRPAPGPLCLHPRPVLPLALH